MIILYYQNDLLNYEKCFVNDKMVAYTLWYYKKNLYGYTLYENKKRKTQIAIKKEFYIDGTLRIEGSTLNGKLHGKKNTFYSNGKLQCDCKYKNGKKDGMQKSFTEGGITEHQGNYKDGRKNGEHIFYHPNGSVWIKKIYDAGKLAEVAENKDSYGNKLDNGRFQDGKGILRIYNEQGHLSYKEYYFRGMMLLRVKIKKR